MRPNRVKTSLRHGASSGALRGRLRRAPLTGREGFAATTSELVGSSILPHHAASTYCYGYSYQGPALPGGLSSGRKTEALRFDFVGRYYRTITRWRLSFSSLFNLSLRLLIDGCFQVSLCPLKRGTRAGFAWNESDYSRRGTHISFPILESRS